VVHTDPIIGVRPRRVIGLIEAEFTTSPTRWTFPGGP
jgi:hypothetical protein